MLRVQRLINHLPADAEFGYAGLGYFKGKSLRLRQTSALWKLKTEPWSGSSSFEGTLCGFPDPGLTAPIEILWVLDDETFELLSFDGNRWKRFPMPLPQKGYYSRGDVLDGVRPVSGQGSLAFTAGDGAWRDGMRKSVPGQPFPLLQKKGRLGATPRLLASYRWEKTCFLVRHERQPYMFTEQQNFQSDTAAIWNGSWIEIPNFTDLHFFADEWTVAGGVGYICTNEKGELPFKYRSTRYLA